MTQLSDLSWTGIGIFILILAAVIFLFWWVEVGSARMHMRQAHREMKSMDWNNWPARVPYPPHPGHATQRREVIESTMQPGASLEEVKAAVTSYSVDCYGPQYRRLAGLREIACHVEKLYDHLAEEESRDQP
jgi:hypothetical protein